MKIIVTGATGMVGEGVMLECLANPSVETSHFGSHGWHVKRRVLFGKFLENGMNRGRNFLKEGVREEKWEEGVEGDGGVYELNESSFDESWCLQITNGCKILECLTSEVGLFLE